VGEEKKAGSGQKQQQQKRKEDMEEERKAREATALCLATMHYRWKDFCVGDGPLVA
jgi:hypothetical protein